MPPSSKCSARPVPSTLGTRVFLVVALIVLLPLPLTRAGSTPRDDPPTAATEYEVALASRPFLMGMNPHPQRFMDDTLSDEQVGAYIDAAFELGKRSMELYPKWPSIPWYALRDRMPVSHFQLYRDVLGWKPMVYVEMVDYYLAGSTWHVRPKVPSDWTGPAAFNATGFVDEVVTELQAFCALDPGPEVVFLGNEVNQIYELEGAAAFAAYVDGMDQITRRLHAASGVPANLTLGIVLSQTQMLVNISNQTPWVADRLWMVSALDALPALDVVGINSYPFKVVADPAGLPADHYTRLGTLTNKPLWFTEIGWPSGAAAGGTEAEQAHFLARFLNLTTTLPVQAVCWISMHDFAERGAYGEHVLSWGLRDLNSTPKAAWDLWMDVKNLTVTGAMRYRLPAGAGGNADADGGGGFTMAHVSLIAMCMGVVGVVVVLLRRRRGD